jgi:hypothetical protein
MIRSTATHPQAGIRTPTLPEVVNQLQRGAERAAIRFNAWQGAPPSTHAIAELQIHVAGLGALLRQVRALTAEPGGTRK